METRLYGLENIKEQDSVWFASCDSKYFLEHAVPWAESITRFEQAAHCHVINPSIEAMGLIAHLNEHMPRLTITFEQTVFPENDNVKRVYYSCNRFLVAGQLLKKARKIAITDIDCLLMQKADIPENTIGLFFRDPLPNCNAWETYGTHVAAGIVSAVGSGGKSYLQLVHNKINEIVISNGWLWFVDQVALFSVFENEKWDDAYAYDKNWLDWEFNEGTIIWTGKGDRKYKDEKYLSAKEDVATHYYTKAKT
jgi:hypothetical protein